jgi:Cdc6-like AAA superfamily ATPase
LGNIATLSREWAAVKRAERSPLRDILLSGAARTLPPAQHLQVPRGLLQHLRDNYNDSQYQALTAGLDGRPLVLIQGPPGTGKTQCAALSSY